MISTAGHYIPQAYPLWAWADESGPPPNRPRLVVGWLCTPYGAEPVFANQIATAQYRFRVSPFDPDAITT